MRLLVRGEAWEVFETTFPAPEKYLYTHFRRRRSAYMHLSGAGEVFIHTSGVREVLICTYLAPEKYLYAPMLFDFGTHTRLMRCNKMTNNTERMVENTIFTIQITYR